MVSETWLTWSVYDGGLDFRQRAGLQAQQTLDIPVRKRSGDSRDTHQPAAVSLVLGDENMSAPQ